MADSGDRMFTEDLIDEWEDLQDRSESVAEYDEDHSEKSLKCTYGKTIAESTNIASNVVLLISLPLKKPLSCLAVRRDVDPTLEISCKVKK